MKRIISSFVILLGFAMFSVANAQSVTPLPTISNISPSQGTSNTSVTIYGTNLSGASVVEFYNSSGQLAASLVPSSASATNVVFTISGTFAAMVAPGTYQVGVVTNACAGGCDSNRIGFTINAPASNLPTISNTNSQLQQTTQSLLDQIKTLQNRLSQMQSSQSVNSSDQSDNAPTSTYNSCLMLSSNFEYRSRDTYTNGEVSVLQDFLQTKGFLSSEPSGFFGLLTLRAVKSFQTANSINPTGYVGPLTRARINSLSCSQ